jgi:PAS domain S-box-containing protein
VDNRIRLRALILEDRPVDAELMLYELQRAGIDLDWSRVDNEADYLDHLQDDLQVILADYSLPQFDASRALDLLQQRGLDIPFIVVTGSISEEVAVATMKQGASDYLLKDRLTRLGTAINQALEQKRVRDARRQAETALRESEERFRRLAENAQDLIYRINLFPTVRFEYISPAAMIITGYAPDEFYSDPDLIWKVVFPDDRHLMEEHLMRRDVPGLPFTLRWQRKDGSVVWAEQRNVPIYDDDGKLTAVEGVARDITERKQRERELETIATVSSALRMAPTVAEMLPAILDQLSDLLGANGASVELLDPATGNLNTELGRGIWTSTTGAVIPSGKGISAQVLASGEPYLNNHMREETRVFFPELLGDCQAVAGVPLVADEHIIGLIWMARVADIIAADLRMLSTIADMAANAIYRASLHEETQQRLERLQALRKVDIAIATGVDLSATLDVLLDQVIERLGVDAADVLLLDDTANQLNYAAGHGFLTSKIQQSCVQLGSGISGSAAFDQQRIYIPDLAYAENFQRSMLLAEENFISYLGTPLVSNGEIKGILEIFHRSYLKPDDEWLDYLEALAGLAAITIDKVQLFEDLQCSNIELAQAYDTTLEGWSRALDLRDRETEGHTQRVTDITIRLARKMEISDDEMVHVRRGSLLHDIGKMGIPDSILLKPGPLTDDEWVIMRRHPQYAHDLLEPIAYLRPALDIPYYHHERWNGSGYPRGLKGEQIPLAARIFAAVDVWDALRSDRPYRPAWPIEEVVRYLKDQAGKGFDPAVVRALLEL